MGANKIQMQIKIASSNTGFEPIKDALEIRRSFQKAIDIEAQVSIQIKKNIIDNHQNLKDQDLIVFGAIKCDSIAEKYLKINLQTNDLEKLINHLKNIKKPPFRETAPIQMENVIQAFPVNKETSPALLSMVYLKGQVILCASLEIQSINGNTVTVSIPNRIFRLQRRKHLRLEISKAYQIDIQYELHPNEKTSKHRLSNLTMSGLAFHVPSSRELGAFKVGSILKNLQFSIRGESIFIEEAIVRHIVQLPKVPTPQGVSIGVEFTSIQEKEEDKIFQYVIQNVGYSMF